jgi:hypothetical protein
MLALIVILLLLPVFGIFSEIPRRLADLTVRHYNIAWYWYIIKLGW